MFDFQQELAIGFHFREEVVGQTSLPEDMNYLRIHRENSFQTLSRNQRPTILN
jgi:hypothetical protein